MPRIFFEFRRGKSARSNRRRPSGAPRAACPAAPTQTTRRPPEESAAADESGVGMIVWPCAPTGARGPPRGRPPFRDKRRSGLTLPEPVTADDDASAGVRWVAAGPTPCPPRRADTKWCACLWPHKSYPCSVTSDFVPAVEKKKIDLVGPLLPAVGKTAAEALDLWDCGSAVLETLARSSLVECNGHRRCLSEINGSLPHRHDLTRFRRGRPTSFFPLRFRTSVPRRRDKPSRQCSGPGAPCSVAQALLRKERVQGAFPGFPRRGRIVRSFPTSPSSCPLICQSRVGGFSFPCFLAFQEVSSACNCRGQRAPAQSIVGARRPEMPCRALSKVANGLPPPGAL